MKVVLLLFLSILTSFIAQSKSLVPGDVFKAFLFADGSFVWNHHGIEGFSSEFQPLQMHVRRLESNSSVLQDFRFYRLDSITNQKSTIFRDKIDVHYIIAVNETNNMCYRISGFGINDIIPFLMDIKKKYSSRTLKWIASQCDIQEVDIACAYSILSSEKESFKGHKEYRKKSCLKRMKDEEDIKLPKCF